jgi:hypothetical protein
VPGHPGAVTATATALHRRNQMSKDSLHHEGGYEEREV